MHEDRKYYQSIIHESLLSAVSDYLRLFLGGVPRIPVKYGLRNIDSIVIDNIVS